MMKKLILYKNSYFVVGLTFLSLSAAAEKAEMKLLLPSEGELQSLETQEKQVIQKDSSATITVDGPTLLRITGRMPVIILPVKNNGAEVKLDPPTFKEAAGSAGQIEVSLIVSEIMISVQNIQRDIQRKKYDSAFIQITELQAKYPGVAFLDFLRGSVLFLQGKRSAAREAVNKALEVHPNFEQGKEFLRQIGGGE